MGLLATYLTDAGRARCSRTCLPHTHDSFGVASWSALERLVHLRPVVGVLVDMPSLIAAGGVDPLRSLSRRYPSLALVLIAPPPIDPRVLYEVGRDCPAVSVVVPGPDDVERRIRWAMAEAGVHRVSSAVLEQIRGVVPIREQTVVQAALEGVHRRWSADRLAASFGYTRPFMSERLKATGLPSVGRLMVWSRLLHAGRWLTDPGRTGQSVSRQLEYSDGAGLRRALRGYLDSTPTAIIERGGFPFVLSRFISECRFREATSKRYVA